MHSLSLAHSLVSSVSPSDRKRPIVRRSSFLWLALLSGLFISQIQGIPVSRAQMNVMPPSSYSSYPGANSPYPNLPYSNSPYANSPYGNYANYGNYGNYTNPTNTRSNPNYPSTQSYGYSGGNNVSYGGYQQQHQNPARGNWGGPPPQQQQQAPPSSASNDNEAYENNTESGNIDEYARFSEEGSHLFSAGQLTQAIEQFEKAMRVAPEGSIPVVYNNLAVVHIKRGNYFHESKHQDDNALSDFRKAYFYLDPAWPEGEERKPLHAKNRQVARDNLTIAYHNLGINPADKGKHVEMARQLRMQGKFQEAIVEYSLALDLDRKDPVAIKSLGDLFTVINMPTKSKKYYALAAGTPIAAASAGQDDTLVQLGNAQYKTGEIDKAVASFDKALEINPSNPGALNMLEKIWKDELGFNPNSVTAHANLGSIYQKKRMYDQALQQYNAAEHFADNDPKTAFDVKKQIRLNLGTLFQAQKRYDLALKAYDTVLQVEPNHVLANTYKATLLEESGNTNGAMQAYNKLLAINPGNHTAQEKLFSLIKNQSDPAKLTEGLKQYADRFATNAAIQAQIGEEFHQRKDLANAAIFYQRAIRIDPKMAGVWANLGSLYQAQGREEDSADAFRKAEALDPNNTTFRELVKTADSNRGDKLYDQAVALQQQGQLQKSLDTFRQALAINDTADIRGAYGVALQQAGQLDGAIGEYKKALAKDPKNAETTYSMGTAYHQKKDLVNAEAAYKSALSIKPGYADAEKALATLHNESASADLDAGIDAYNKQQYVPALTHVNQALSKNAQDSTAYYYQGLILDAQKKPTQAVQSYRSAIKYNANFSDAYYALGVALDNTKDTAGARTAFEKFLEIAGNNDDDFVKYARERVKAMAGGG